LALPALAAVFHASQLNAALPAETRDVLREWVDVKSLISEEREEWAIEKAALVDTISLLQEEKTYLNEQIEAREQAAETAMNERTELSLRKETLEEQAEAVADLLGGFESDLSAWIGNLPGFLQEELTPLIRRLPAGNGPSAEQMGLARRLQTVVGILSQSDKFNSSLTLRNELRRVDSESAERETSTLYFGLAYALFVDAEASYAGYGTPGPSGWEWVETPEHAEAIRDLIAVYKSETPAAYVAVPLHLN
jgi:hypothetical protein